ncbi:formin-like protein 18 isoform X2 [Pollicipes pollicipes]|uniref:formin-like protein 18 isoform X2 n=1 Tax=Pollicipes pollicipes TaxID=41117 RepID=UPI0018855A7C|nr:formin-like protein 18 isoform X2 [Pollicipes pollicipes]
MSRVLLALHTITGGLVLLVAVGSLVCCYFCTCCPVHRWLRRRGRVVRTNNGAPLGPVRSAQTAAPPPPAAGYDSGCRVHPPPPAHAHDPATAPGALVAAATGYAQGSGYPSAPELEPRPGPGPGPGWAPHLPPPAGPAPWQSGSNIRMGPAATLPRHRAVAPQWCSQAAAGDASLTRRCR